MTFFIALICSGLVPQQPPTIFKYPLDTNSDISFAIKSGLSSYSHNSFGSPALGCADTEVLAIFDNSAI